MSIDVKFFVSEKLVATCRGYPERERWLADLPELICDLRSRWQIDIDNPFDGSEGSCAWVAPALRADGSPAVLKLAMPHMEGEHEIRALQFWEDEPTVRLLETDESCYAMLLERCEPGAALRVLPENEQDVMLANLLRQLWLKSPPRDSFRPLSVMLAQWASETLAQSAQWPDAGLVKEGLYLFEVLSRPNADEVLLATDLHAGNVLSARRKPWLVIDPKPFVGDRTYDATQHLLNCKARLLSSPYETIKRFADLLEIDHERLRLWLFARAAAEPRDVWNEDSLVLARRLCRTMG